MTFESVFRRAMHLATFVIVASLAQPALATINCEILPTGSTSLTVGANQSLSLDLEATGGACSDVTVTITEISNANGTVVTPPSFTGPGPFSFSGIGGAVNGTAVFRAECISGCFGSPANTIIDYTVEVVVPVVQTLTPLGPTSITGNAGDSLLIQVRAEDDGLPAGTTILWSATGPIGLSTASSNTNAAGVAGVTVTFGPGTGAATLEAQRADNGDVLVDYMITVIPPVVRTLVALNGDGQSGPTGTPAANPLVVETRNDGSPAPGVALTWAVISGDATLTSAGSPTGATGQAQATVTFGATLGPVVVRASRNDAPTVFVDFTLTSTLTRTLALVSGNGQSAPTQTALSSPLIVEAQNNGAPVAGISLVWSVVSGDATLITAGASTDAAGRAQTGVQFGVTPGPVVIRASRVDDPTAQVDFTLTSTLIRTLSLISGNGQTALTRTAVPNPLVVEARDNGNPASGINLLWSVVSGDATLVSPVPSTDAAGRAQTGVQFGATPGPVVIRASRVDDPTAQVDFTLTSTFTRTITVISGANQQGLPGLPLPNPIVVEVRGNGLPEAGVTVDISVSGGNATISGDGEASPKVLRVTGTDGRASANVTLGSTGTVSILASVPSDPGVSVTVAATGNNLADLPGLPEPLQELGGAIQLACGAIAQIPTAQRTAEQTDLLARCQGFAGASPGEIAAALNELLPDTTLTMVTVALQAGQAQLDNLKARIAALRSGTQGSKFGGLAIASPAGNIPVTSLFGTMLGATESPEVGTDFDRWGYFVSGTLGRGESDPGRLSPGYDFDINGLTVGVDYRFSERFVGGASVGYTRQDTDLAGGQGNVDADGYSLSAYATFYRDQSWYTDAVLTWGRNDYETVRRIRYTLSGPGGTSTIDQTARGQLDGDQLSFASTLGRDYQAGTWTIGPYGRMLYSRIDFDAGREVIAGGVGSGLALEIFPGAHTSLASVAGAKFSTALSRDWGILMPHLQVEWEHEYRDDPQRVGARFLADPNATRFTIEGDPIDNSFFRVGGGLSVLFTGGRSGFFYVERVIGKSGFTQTNLALGIRGEF